MFGVTLYENPGYALPVRSPPYLVGQSTVEEVGTILSTTPTPGLDELPSQVEPSSDDATLDLYSWMAFATVNKLKLSTPRTSYDSRHALHLSMITKKKNFLSVLQPRRFASQLLSALLSTDILCWAWSMSVPIRRGAFTCRTPGRKTMLSVPMDKIVSHPSNWSTKRPRSRFECSFAADSSSSSLEYFENDLVAVQQKPDAGRSKDEAATVATSGINDPPPPRLCVVRPDGTLAALCQHLDDVETDLWLDPRTSPMEMTDDNVVLGGCYGEGWYGQRPVPSLGGGPGYGAEADEIWSIDQDVFDKLMEDGVEIPVLDVGIAHGEKARGGALDFS